MKPTDQIIVTDKSSNDPYNEESHLKILIPVGTAITIVAAVKYARVSISKPTLNI
jgi:hypothetical protein